MSFPRYQFRARLVPKHQNPKVAAKKLHDTTMAYRKRFVHNRSLLRQGKLNHFEFMLENDKIRIGLESDLALEYPKGVIRNATTQVFRK